MKPKHQKRVEAIERHLSDWNYAMHRATDPGLSREQVKFWETNAKRHAEIIDNTKKKLGVS